MEYDGQRREDAPKEAKFLQTCTGELSPAGSTPHAVQSENSPQRARWTALCRHAQADAICRGDWAAAQVWARRELDALELDERPDPPQLARLYRRLGQLSSRQGNMAEALSWYQRLLERHLASLREGKPLENWISDWGVYLVLLGRDAPVRPEDVAYWAQELECVLPGEDPRLLRAWEDVGYACLRGEDAAGAVAALRRVLRDGPQPGFLPMRTYHALGVAYGRLGRHQEAIDAFAQCVKTAQQAGRGEHVMVGDAMVRTAMALEHLNRLLEAARVMEAVLARPTLAKQTPRERAIIYNVAGRIERRLGRHDRALERYRQALREQGEGLGAVRADILVGMAYSLEELGKTEDALGALVEARRWEVSRHGESSAASAEACRRIHGLLSRMGRPEDAVMWCERELQAYEDMKERGVPYVRALHARAQYLEQAERFREAAEACEAAAAADLVREAAGSEETMTMLFRKALCQLRVPEDGSEVVKTMERVMALAEAHLDPDSSQWSGILETLAMALEKAGRNDEALDCLRRLVERHDPEWEKDPIMPALAYHKMANMLQRQGDLQQARQCLLQSLAMMQKTSGYDREWAMTLKKLGYLSIRLKALPLARSYFIQGAALCQNRNLQEDSLYTDLLRGLGQVDFMLQNYVSSRGALERARDLAISQGDEEKLASVFLELAETLGAMGEGEEAVETARQGLRLRQRRFPLRHMLVGTAWNTLGRVAYGAGLLEEALHAYHRAAQCLQSLEERPEIMLGDIAFSAAMIYRRREEWSKAREELRAAWEAYERRLGMQEKTAVTMLALAEMLIIENQGDPETDELLDRVEAYWGQKEVRHRLLEIHLLRGLLLRERGDLAGAREQFYEALAICSQQPERFADQAQRVEGLLRELEQSIPPVRKAKILLFPGTRELE